jgi:DeoR/GlpR family transcriptional regulator of sugar metabolism
MLAAERQAKIVQEIQRRGAAKVADLVDLFGAGMTIRRELDVLAQQGLVDKVYGGATRRARSSRRLVVLADHTKWAFVEDRRDQ